MITTLTESRLVRHARRVILRRTALGLPFVAVCVLAFASANYVLAGSDAGSPAMAAPSEPNISSIVIVTDDRYAGEHGCDSISVFGLPDLETHFRGPFQADSPGRLAGNQDLSVVVAQPANGHGTLEIARHVGSGVGDWKTALVESDHAALVIGGGVAMLPDGSSLLAAVSDSARPPRLSYWPPYSVRKFPSPRDGATTLGAESGRLVVGEGLPYEVLLSRNGRLAHVLTNRGDLITFDTVTMLETADRVTFDRPPSALHLAGSLHATLSPDESRIIANIADEGSVVLIDLVGRVAKTIKLPSAHQTDWTGGVAFNHAPLNHGLLAVHRTTQVDVYRVAAGDDLLRVGHARIHAPASGTRPTIFAAAEWSADGAHIIAASDTQTGFVVLDVLDEGRHMAERGTFMPCTVTTGARSLPNDILTGNRFHAPTSTPEATATWTATATETLVTPTNTPEAPSPTPSPNASSTESPASSPSPTATEPPVPTLVPTPTERPAPTATDRPPQPVYIPVALKESCPPEDVFADVVLVIDASTSMLEITSSRRRKLDVATEAAMVFASGMRLVPGGDRLAIVTFNDGAQTLQHLTSVRSRVDAALGRIDVVEHSRVDLGVERAMVELITRGRHGHVQAMIVLSDGKANPVPGDQAVTAARRAQLEDITVYVVGMGPSMDERVLRQMASGDDRYYPAPDPLLIRAIYHDLTKRVPCPPEAYWGRR